MRSPRLPWILLILAVASTLARVAWVWDALPTQMASHFDGGGRPNGWKSKAEFFASFLPFCVAMPLLLATASRWLRWLPSSLINLPNRDYWLTPERRHRAAVILGGGMLWFAVALAAFLAGMSELTLHANLKQQSLAPIPLAALMAGFVCATIAFLIWTYRAFRVPADGET